MKVIVTGSLGNISKPLTVKLIAEGHEVTVISSSPSKQTDITLLGATPAIGSLEDTSFLTNTFNGADAVYLMVPPNNYFDPNLDLVGYYHRIGLNYADAIRKSGVKRVVHLSSIGAHLNHGTGNILAHHDVETIFNALEDVFVTFIRPTSFYYNLYGYISMIKKEGYIAANYSGDIGTSWVSPMDIAEAIVDELSLHPSGRKVRYVVSDELTGYETALILGTAIGKPDLNWVTISDKQMQSGLVKIGMNKHIAQGLVEMYGSLRDGVLEEDYYHNRPVGLGKVKMTDFAKEFALAYHQI